MTRKDFIKSLAFGAAAVAAGAKASTQRDDWIPLGTEEYWAKVRDHMKHGPWKGYYRGTTTKTYDEIHRAITAELMWHTFTTDLPTLVISVPGKRGD